MSEHVVDVQESLRRQIIQYMDEYDCKAAKQAAAGDLELLRIIHDEYNRRSTELLYNIDLYNNPNTPQELKSILEQMINFMTNKGMVPAIPAATIDEPITIKPKIE